MTNLYFQSLSLLKQDGNKKIIQIHADLEIRISPFDMNINVLEKNIRMNKINEKHKKKTYFEKR